MTRARPRKRSAVAGFTLIEALVATVLMGMILAALSTVTAQWLGNWDRGFARAQRGELVSIALDRLVADIGAAEFITANHDLKVPLFDGTPLGVTLVRTAFGPNARPGLEVVRIAETADRNGAVLVRTKTPYAPLPTGAVTPNPASFTDPVALLRAPFRVTFAYAGRDRIYKDFWQGLPLLPTTVQITVRDAASARTLSISTASLVHVELPAACVGAKDKNDCFSKPDGGPENAQQQGQPQGQGAPTSPGAQQNAVRSL
jgi:general secretion pathway protein J